MSCLKIKNRFIILAIKFEIALDVRSWHALTRNTLYFLFTFAVSFVMHSPLAIFKTHQGNQCPLYIERFGNVERYYTLFTFICMYIIPLSIISLCYAKILMIVWRKTSAGTESAAAHERSIRQKRKTTRMVFIVVLLFAVCWGPIQCMNMYNNWGNANVANWSKSFFMFFVSLKLFAVCLCYANSCVNPFIYAFTQTTFKKHFRKIFAICIPEEEDIKVEDDGATSGYRKIGKYTEYSSMTVTTLDTKV